MTAVSARAATWRDAAGAIRATVYGASVCERPKEPRSFAAVSGDGRYECIFRCRDCEACRQLDAIWLRRRLVAGAAQWGEQLCAVQISFDARGKCSASALSRRIGRSLDIIGWIRSGTSGVVFIATGTPSAVRARLTSHGRSCRVRPVKSPARLRAWRRATRGLVVARSEYGADLNRWYIRGLPKVQREVMTLEHRGGIRKRHPDARAGVRAWREGLSLYPADLMLVADLMRAARASSSRRGERSPINRQPRGARLSGVVNSRSTVLPARLQCELAAIAGGSKADKAARAATALSERPPLSFKGGRDATSSLPVKFDPMEWAERMAKKARERDRPP
jgi:hypothetical protein